MTQNNYLRMPPLQPAVLIRRMLFGVALGLAVGLFFVLSVNHARPEWGSLWMVRPLIVLPLAGAGAGFISYLLDALRTRGGWKAVAAVTLSILVFTIALWMGIVLGFVGTLWH